MEGSAQESLGTQSSWLRCYRCWSQNLEVQLHYEGILKVDADTGEAVDPVEEVQEAVVQCLDCLHDQPHLSLATGKDAETGEVKEVDVLEAGVEIFAQPPGKKNTTVDQLSGGEKALTAVALVFSIFLIKPSPFCILDEVDAPLDESNVDR